VEILVVKKSSKGWQKDGGEGFNGNRSNGNGGDALGGKTME